MKFILITACFLSLLSCKGKKATVADGQPTSAAIDSTSSSQGSFTRVMVERARLDQKEYTVSVQTEFSMPPVLKEDSSYYFVHDYVVVKNKINHTTDTLQIDGMEVRPSDAEIDLVPDSLHFKTLAFDISWKGDSDIPNDEFIAYYDNKLSELFSITNLVSVQRKDKTTFSGFVIGRDELVQGAQDNYPFTVSTKDKEVHIENPPVQYIGYPTTALEDIKGYRVSTQGDSAAYTIKKGTELTVDTLYRLKNIVRLRLADSTIIRVPTNDISDKLQHDIAG